MPKCGDNDETDTKSRQDIESQQKNCIGTVSNKHSFFLFVFVLLVCLLLFCIFFWGGGRGGGVNLTLTSASAVVQNIKLAILLALSSR